jgi:hypothetical protein
MKQYVIRSVSEHGYWHNVCGWVETMEAASRFRQSEREQFHLPVSSGLDAQWIEYTGPRY